MSSGFVYQLDRHRLVFDNEKASATPMNEIIELCDEIDKARVWNLSGTAVISPIPGDGTQEYRIAISQERDVKFLGDMVEVSEITANNSSKLTQMIRIAVEALAKVQSEIERLNKVVQDQVKLADKITLIHSFHRYREIAQQALKDFEAGK